MNIFQMLVIVSTLYKFLNDVTLIENIMTKLY